MDLNQYLKNILPTIRELLSLQGNKHICDILKLSNMEYDEVTNDFGNDFDEVIIKVPTDRYISLKTEYNSIESLEQIILNAFVEATKGMRSPYTVTIRPNSNIQDTLFESGEYQGWRNGYFRMFISHVASKKDKASSLKAELENYGITSFVAHEDIYPTKEWIKEIEKALNSMDCMSAMQYEGFHDSNWCDQEVGIAIGRNITVLPLIIDDNPYGFLGEYQGVKIKGMYPDKLGKKIFEILCDNANTRTKYLTCLTNIFLSSNNVDDANKWLSLIESVPNTDYDFWMNIQSHVKENDVLNNPNVMSRLNIQFKKRNIPTISADVTMITNSDDLPF